MPSQPQSDRKLNTRLQRAIETILTDRPIAYHAVLAKAVGSANAGIFLSQLLYWTPRAHDKDGWIYKTQQDIYEETALTRREQETARRLLRTAKVLEEKRAGVPSRLFFRVDMGCLAQLLGGDSDREDDNEVPEPDKPDPLGAAHDVQNVHRTMAHNAIPEWRKPTDKNGGNHHTIYEAETTTENTITENVVVAALINFGISKKTAEKLGDDYPHDYLLAKLNLVQWLVETGSRLVGKNPAGYLRRAIEDDYAAPPQYESPAHRTERQEAEQERRRVAEVEFRISQERIENLLREQHPTRPIPGTQLTTETAWAQTLASLQAQIPRPTYETWLRRTLLLDIESDTAFISVGSSFAKEWLEQRLYQAIAKGLSNVLGREVEIEFITHPTEELAIAGATGE